MGDALTQPEATTPKAPPEPQADKDPAVGSAKVEPISSSDKRPGAETAANNNAPEPYDEHQWAPELPPEKLYCNDRDYIRQLRILRKIKELLVSEAVKIDPKDRILVHLGQLNSVKFSRNGSAVTAAQWNDLDHRLEGLTPYLIDETGILKRKLQVGIAPKFLYWLPLAMALVAAVSLCVAVGPPAISLLSWIPGMPKPTLNTDEIRQIWQFAAFMAWLISLGSLGSIAFLYVNVLSIETDKTVDVTSESFVLMRIILGALFGLVIGLPVGYFSFVTFCHEIYSAAAVIAKSMADGATPTPSSPVDWSSGLSLLLPFMLGFSTPLVLNVLKRLIDGAQTVFGIQNSSGQKDPTSKS